MDGQHRETPIIPNEIVPVEFEDGTYLNYGGWVDSIHMFAESRLSHVKYWDENGCVSFQFLSDELLAGLAERGIPVVMRDSIFEREVQAHKDHCWNLAEALGMVVLEDEIDYTQLPPPVPLELMPGDPIEAEVQKAHEHIDAEADYYLKEWGS